MNKTLTQKLLPMIVGILLVIAIIGPLSVVSAENLEQNDEISKWGQKTEIIDFGKNVNISGEVKESLGWLYAGSGGGKLVEVMRCLWS